MQKRAFVGKLIQLFLFFSLPQLKVPLDTAGKCQAT